jgi:hypothetical protein
VNLRRNKGGTHGHRHHTKGREKAPPGDFIQLNYAPHSEERKDREPEGEQDKDSADPEARACHAGLFDPQSHKLEAILWLMWID